MRSRTEYEKINLGEIYETLLVQRSKFLQAAGDGGRDDGADEDVIAFVFGGEHFGLAVEEADEIGALLGNAVIVAFDAIRQDHGAVFEQFLQPDSGDGGKMERAGKFPVEHGELEGIGDEVDFIEDRDRGFVGGSELL